MRARTESSCTDLKREETSLTFMGDFIHIVGNEGEVLDVELDDDGTFTVETLKNYFGEQAVGLKYI